MNTWILFSFLPPFLPLSKSHSPPFQNIKKARRKLNHESDSEVAQSCPTVCDPKDSSLHQAPPSMGFSRQEYWSGLPFPSPEDLPDPGLEPRSPTLQADALTSAPPGKPQGKP